MTKLFQRGDQSATDTELSAALEGMRPRSYRRAERLDSIFVIATTKSGKGRPMKIGTLFEFGVLGAISLNNRDFYLAGNCARRRCDRVSHRNCDCQLSRQFLTGRSFLRITKSTC